MANPSIVHSTARIVLDTNVWLDLLWFDDPRSRWLMSLLESRQWRALCNDDCRSEWQRVLSYPVLRIPPAQVDALNLRFDALAVEEPNDPRDSTPAKLPLCRDPDDQKFLELAVHGGATVLLTRDDALLELDRRVHAMYPLRIWTPEQAYVELTATDHSAAD